MTMCPRCGSSFLQPLRCEAKGSDVVLVELRCSDCMTWLKAPHTRADMRELDRLQAEFRAVILEQYERSVAESMEALAACLGPALELDLVSADDFAPRARRERASRSAPQSSSAIPARIAKAPPTIPAIARADPRPAGRHDELAGARARAQQPDRARRARRSGRSTRRCRS